jgi:hypothetical protein
MKLSLAGVVNLPDHEVKIYRSLYLYLTTMKAFAKVNTSYQGSQYSALILNFTDGDA